MLKKVDFLIVGQGIAGTLLALRLMEEGQNVLVLDEDKEHTSSKKAGGLYNPITGRQMVKTWLADDLFTNLQGFYDQLEQQLGAKFHYPKTIYRPFFSVEEQNDWQGKVSLPEYAAYIKQIYSGTLGLPEVQDRFGGLELNRSGSVDLPVMLAAAKGYLLKKGNYLKGKMDFHKLEQTGSAWQFENLEARNVIFCEGPDALNNPFFKTFLFKPVKGEVLEMELSLPEDRIINRGVFMLPKDGFFKVGSTYDHSVLDHEPTEKGKSEIIDRLSKVYKGQVSVVGHTAGVRPATYDRRPFIGMLEKYPNIGIFNGFGTKGVSLVPFFATQFVNYLLRGEHLLPEVDIRRLKKG